MKTTLDIPDELMREVKHRAVEENRKLKDMIAELLRIGLAGEPLVQPVICIEDGLPIIKSSRPARPGEEMTAERMKEILLQEEAEHYLDSLR